MMAGMAGSKITLITNLLYYYSKLGFLIKGLVCLPWLAEQGDQVSL